MQREVNAAAVIVMEGLIRPYVRRTPVLEVHGSDFGLEDGVLTFKLELCQHAGSFKTRGAFANLLTRDIPPAGVVAASGGNHGVAVAYAASRLGVGAKIFVPTVASPAKMAAISGFQAELVVIGDRYADALAASEQWAQDSGAMPIHAFDQPETLIGQGTLGLELDQQAEELDTLLVAVGGGGLIGGIATWFAERAPGRRPVRIIAVEPEQAPTLSRALDAGRPVDAPAGGIAADSLAPRRVGELSFPIAQKHVDRVLLVSDSAIRHAQEQLWSRLRIVAEPGGAAATAALLAGLYRPAPGERVGVIVCGGNTTAVDFSESTAV
jgi:threonine dehydratase